ncbi:hypothetical protein COB55_05155 [Candidatus Wolfebacteria bacterium]|nr:MAG: hypothetical protein COB55_05155 [Candidatus Wolfebacteria bacterium]
MNFKVGDKVRIRKDSVLYNDWEYPKDTNGSVVTIQGTEIVDIRIIWENGHEGWCLVHELEYWYTEPLRELLGEIDYNHNSIRIVINLMIKQNFPLSNEQLQKCRDVWEKYNKK